MSWAAVNRDRNGTEVIATGSGSTEAGMNFVGSKVQVQITSKHYDRGDSKTVGGF